MKAVLLYSGHAIAEISHDNHVRMVCIDTYEAVHSLFYQWCTNIHIDLDNNSEEAGHASSLVMNNLMNTLKVEPFRSC